MVYKQNNNLHWLPTVQMISVNMYAKTKMIKRHCFDQTVSQTWSTIHSIYRQSIEPLQARTAASQLCFHLICSSLRLRESGVFIGHWFSFAFTFDCYDYHYDRLSKQWGSLIASIARRRIASIDWPVSCSKGPPYRSDMRRRRSDRSYVECRSDWRWTPRVPELYQALQPMQWMHSSTGWIEFHPQSTRPISSGYEDTGWSWCSVVIDQNI